MNRNDRFRWLAIVLLGCAAVRSALSADEVPVSAALAQEGPALAPVPVAGPARLAPPMPVAPSNMPPIPEEGPAPQYLEHPAPHDPYLVGPILSGQPPPVQLPAADAPPTDRPFPINLATALRLAHARPLVIAAAQAGVQIAAGQLEKAEVLWLPNVNAGAAYIRHDGGQQEVSGALINNSTNFFLAGGSLEVRFATTDAIFAPLAARQVMQARLANVQTARNDALLATAEAYFNVQQARGTFLAMKDSVAKGRDLVTHVEGLARGLSPQVEVDRAYTFLAELEQSAAFALQQWRVSSANLTRVLRLDPTATIVPLEPDYLQVTLFSQQQPVDDLIPIGLMNRPELAAHQSLVQATVARLREERLRPLIPSVLLTGNGTPDFFYQGGIFGTGTNGRLDQFAGRSDVAAQLVWKVDNLGFGNRARIRERRGEWQLALVELFSLQDRVAAEVAQAKAELESAAVRVVQAEQGLKRGLTTYAGNLKGLGQTTRFGDVLILVNRPQEVVAALQQLQQAYDNYFRTVADYNRAQFRLFHALGYPAGILACERTPGVPEPVDPSRPPYLPPVCAPEPCTCPCPPR